MSVHSFFKIRRELSFSTGLFCQQHLRREMLILGILFSPILLIITWFTFRVYKWLNNPLRYFPSPKETFFKGHTAHFKSGDHVNTLLKFANLFKKEGLYTLDLLKYPRHVMVVAPEFVKQMVQDSKTFDNSGLNLKNEMPLVGDSMVVCSGENHHWQRKVLNAAFTPQKLKNYFVFFCSHTDKLIQVWLDTCDKTQGTNKNVFEDLSNLTFDIIGDAGFSYQFNSVISPSLNFFTSSLRKSVDHQSKENEALISKTLDKIINTRKEELLAGKESLQEDFVGIMLKAQQEDKRMTDKLIRDNVFMFLAAGHDTVSVGLLWCLYVLGTNLDVQERLREELNAIFSTVENMKYDDLSKCKYLDCVIKETLRVHSPSAVLDRTTTRPVKFGDYNLPAGCHLRAPIQSLHMNPDVFEDPFVFKPERFEKGTDPSALFMTFGQGMFNCIGKNFGLLEMKTILAKMVLRFEFTVDQENLHYEKRIQVLSRPSKPIFIRVKPLSHDESCY